MALHSPREDNAARWIWWSWIEREVGDPVDAVLYESARLANGAMGGHEIEEQCSVMLDRLEELGVDVDGLGLRRHMPGQLAVAAGIIAFGRAPSSKV